MTGVVLAGGRSSRLGQDKVRLCLGNAEQADMLSRTLALLTTCTEKVAVSCRAESCRAEKGDLNLENPFPCRFVPDLVPGLGPLGGLYSCLRVLGGPLLVLPCDLPFMDQSVLCRLVRARQERAEGQCMTCFQDRESGRLEPLVAVYEAECLPWFEKAVAAGIRRLSQVVPAELRAQVLYDRSDPITALPFFNINTPSDLEEARRHAGQS